MKLSRFSVTQRLAFAFGVVLLISIAVAVFSITKFDYIGHNLEDVAVNNAKVSATNEVVDGVKDGMVALRNLVLLEDKAKVEAALGQLKEAHARYDEHWADLLKAPAGQRGLAMREKIAAARAAVLPLDERVVALLRADQRAEAVALVMGASSTANQLLKDLLEEDISMLEGLSTTSFEEAQQAHEQARLLLIVASLLSVAVAAGLAWLVTRSITQQLGAEPGAVVDLVQAVAQGDLSQDIRLQPGDHGSLMSHVKDMQASLVKVVAGVRENAESVATASAEISQGNADLSQRTEQQASALEETAASMEELGSAVQQNADHARQANQLAQGASEVAAQGGAVVGEVVETMKSINDSSRRIADIIGVIDGIAFQTNILALNAAVEAARAGEQGRGFAVVAAEVRSLAHRSADAAREIKTLIGTSVERVEQGSALVDRAGATMNEVVSSIRRVTDIMGEISAASSEQSRGVAQVGEAISQMDQVTQQNAALVEQSAAASDSLKLQAGQLVQAMAVFRTGRSAAQSQAAPAAAARPASKPASKPPYKPLPKATVKASSAAVPEPSPQQATQTVLTKVKAMAAAPAAAPPAKPSPATGGNDDWETF